MENKKSDAEEYVKSIVDPIFRKVLEDEERKGRLPHEPKKNQVLVGSGQSINQPEGMFYLWQPHNFRRYFKYDRSSFKPRKPRKHPHVPTYVGSDDCPVVFRPFSWDYEYKTANWDSEHHFFGFAGCTIKVRKTQVEVVHTELKDLWVKIDAFDIKDIDRRIEFWKGLLEEHCKHALRQFVRVHGGRSDFRIIKRHSENKVKGDGFIEKIPADMMLHDSVMKKVYKERNVELYGEAAVKNHFKNTTLSYVAPEIAEEISKLGEGVAEGLSDLKSSVSSGFSGSAEKLDKLVGVTGSLVELQKSSQTGTMAVLERLGTTLLKLEAQIDSHMALIKVWKDESEERRKPFFVRWYQYLFKRSN